MGCDISLIVEKKQGDHWIEDEDHTTAYYFDDSRNYTLFSVLANVRNGKSIIPICEPKGLPDDASEICKLFIGRGHACISYHTVEDLLTYNWEPLEESCGRFINETIPKLLDIGKPDEVRIVFGFDC